MTTCHRRSYSRLYLVFRNSDGTKTALVDHADGKLLAFTDWSVATKAAASFGGMVTNWEEFKRRGLGAWIQPAPTALRIAHTDKKGVAHTYHAELDASAEELSALNPLTPYDERHTPNVAAAAKKGAKVWEEKP